MDVNPGINLFEVCFGPEKAVAVRGALTMLVLSGLAPEEVSDAIRRIDRETAIGPMLDPTAYLNGRRFDNAAEHCSVLRALHSLIVALEPARRTIQEVRS